MDIANKETVKVQGDQKEASAVETATRQRGKGEL